MHDVEKATNDCGIGNEGGEGGGKGAGQSLDAPTPSGDRATRRFGGGAGASEETIGKEAQRDRAEGSPEEMGKEGGKVQ